MRAGRETSRLAAQVAEPWGSSGPESGGGESDSVHAFRRTLTVLARDVAEVELLVIDGKNSDAVKLFEGKVHAAADPAHEKFGGEGDS